MPCAGVIMCLAQDGGVHVGLGAAGDCPCPPLPDGTHPPCVDVVLDGVRDLLPPDVPVPDLLPSAWLALGAATPLRWIALDEAAGPCARHGPRPPDAGPPSIRRALCERAAVLLLI